jgi:hypothetical protein
MAIEGEGRTRALQPLRTEPLRTPTIPSAPRRGLPSPEHRRTAQALLAPAPSRARSGGRRPRGRGKRGRRPSREGARGGKGAEGRTHGAAAGAEERGGAAMAGVEGR